MKYIFYKTCFTLKLLENQLEQDMFQIWGWYLKQFAFSEIVFGCSTKLLH